MITITCKKKFCARHSEVSQLLCLIFPSEFGFLLAANEKQQVSDRAFCGNAVDMRSHLVE